MKSSASVQFFEQQFRQQATQEQQELNPFEQLALPYLRGHVLDYGCGMGNLSLAAARQGCRVLALDASATGVAHLRAAAHKASLPIEATVADLRTYELDRSFDAIVSIGLLMFFDCPTAWSQLSMLKRHVKPGGVLAINVLIEGTSYLDMFDPQAHCLFDRSAIPQHFAGWDVVELSYQDFAAANNTVKSFVTLVARKPEETGAGGLRS